MRDNNMLFVLLLALCGSVFAIDVAYPVQRQDYPLSWNRGESGSVPFQTNAARPSTGVYRVSRQEFVEPRRQFMSPYVAYYQTPPQTMYWYPPINGNRFQAYPADPMVPIKFPSNNYVPKLFVPAADQVKPTYQSVNRPSSTKAPTPQPESGSEVNDDSVLPATRAPSEYEGEPLPPISGNGVTKPPNRKYVSFNDDVEVNFEVKDLLASLKPAYTRSDKPGEQFERSRRFAMHTIEVPPKEITPDNFFNLLFRPDEALPKEDSVTGFPPSSQSTDVDTDREPDAATDLPPSTGTTEATEPAMVSEDTPAVIACEYPAEPSLELVPIETVQVNIEVRPVVYYLAILAANPPNSNDAEDDFTTTPASLPEDEESGHTLPDIDIRFTPKATDFPPEATADFDLVESSTKDIASLILGAETTSEPMSSAEKANASRSANPSDNLDSLETQATSEPDRDQTDAPPPEWLIEMLKKQIALSVASANNVTNVGSSLDETFIPPPAEAALEETERNKEQLGNVEADSEDISTTDGIRSDESIPAEIGSEEIFDVRGQDHDQSAEKANGTIDDDGKEILTAPSDAVYDPNSSLDFDTPPVLYASDLILDT